MMQEENKKKEEKENNKEEGEKEEKDEEEEEEEEEDEGRTGGRLQQYKDAIRTLKRENSRKQRTIDSLLSILHTRLPAQLPATQTP